MSISAICRELKNILDEFVIFDLIKIMCEYVYELPDKCTKSIKMSSPILCVKKTSDGSVIVCERDGIIKIYDTPFCTYKKILSFTLSASIIVELIDRNIWIIDRQQNIYIINSYNGVVVKNFNPHREITEIIKFRNYCVSISYDNIIDFWSCSGELCYTFRPKLQRYIWSNILSYFDKYIVLGQGPDIIIYGRKDEKYKKDNKEFLEELFNNTSNITACSARGHVITNIIKLNNGNIVSGSSEGEIKIWDISSLRLLYVINTGNYVLSLSESIGGYIVSGCYDSTVQFWEIQSGKCIKSLQKKDAAGTWFVVELDDKRLMSCALHSDTIYVYE